MIKFLSESKSKVPRVARKLDGQQRLRAALLKFVRARAYTECEEKKRDSSTILKPIKTLSRNARTGAGI